MFNTFFIQPIFNLLLFFYAIVGDYGLAIILFVILIKLILWPVTKIQMAQSRKMMEMQPEMRKIRKQTKGNRQLEMIMMMQLRQKYGIKTSHALLTSLIQLPIIIAMYMVVRLMISEPNVFQENTYGFLANLESVKQLLASHANFKPMLFGVVDLTGIAIKMDSLNSLVLMSFAAGSAIMQYLIIKQNQPKGPKRRLRDVFAEAADGEQPDQMEMNQIVARNMNTMMPIMLFVTFSSIYGALAFYSFFNSLLSYAQRQFFNRNMPELNIAADETPISSKSTKQDKGERAATEVRKRAKKARQAQIIEQEVKQKQRVTKIKANVKKKG